MPTEELEVFFAWIWLADSSKRELKSSGVLQLVNYVPHLFLQEQYFQWEANYGHK